MNPKGIRTGGPGRRVRFIKPPTLARAPCVNTTEPFYDIIGEGRPEDLDEVCAAEMVGHAGAGSNLADLKASIASFLAPFPDLAADVRHLVQEGDLVSVWLTYTATHEAEFAGARPADAR